jgi:HD superfamily phosphohydrolase
MSLSNKIDDIIEFIFNNFGIREKFPKKSKLLIHDNVFGTLKFTEFERKVINSPFLQRLTQIHQMGLAFFVYPGAVHKRFSHSLGVSYLSEKVYSNLIIPGINRDKKNIKKILTL